MLGGEGEFVPMPRIEQVEDLDPSTAPGSRLPGHHRRLLGHARAGSRGRSTVGTPVDKPTPVFTKLDPSVVDEELARLGA